jgi:ATP-dependent Clp protease ATP-binding subunit ClpB
MLLDKFTNKAQMAIADAQELALSKQHQQIDVEHLLFVLINQKRRIVTPILEKAGLVIQDLV